MAKGEQRVEGVKDGARVDDAVVVQLAQQAHLPYPLLICTLLHRLKSHSNLHRSPGFGIFALLIMVCHVTIGLLSRSLETMALLMVVCHVTLVLSKSVETTPPLW